MAMDVSTPTYDRSALTVGIAHIGVGGFHRAHEAAYLDALFTQGIDTDWALQGIGVLPSDRTMAEILNAQDGLYTLVIKNEDGTLDPRIIGSIKGMSHLLDDPEGVLALLSDPALRIVSLTITEGGYPASPDDLSFDADHVSVRADIANPAGPPTTAFGLLVHALRRRHELGLAPFTVLSCDNIRHNGAVARASVLGLAELVAPEHLDWFGTVAFPNSMVDRITPSTTDADRELVASWGVDDAWPVVCEPFTQWVIEDDFPAGRPAWEKVGAQFTDDVEPYELMKLRMLNAGHQLIGHLGRHLGLTYSHETLQHPALRALLRRFMTREAIPTLQQPEGIDLLAYRDSLLTRFGNPAVKDSLARLCAYASDRIPKFLLGTVRDNLASGGEISISALVLAAWALGSRALDENGQTFAVVDELADELREASLRENTTPGAFLDHPVFEGLGQNARLRSEYLTALDSLQRLGTEGTISAL